jgi:hypothetical protein
VVLVFLGALLMIAVGASGILFVERRRYRS